MILPCRRILTATLVACPAAVWAGGSAGPVELQGVTVIGQAAAQDPDSATIGTVYSEQFQYRPLTRPGELMEVVPGLIVTQHSGEGKANQYFLRGFNLDHGTDFATFVDGMPVNLPSHAHGQGYSDLNFMIPELVDSIQYRKGPYYAQYGDFSAAGAADIRYKDRLDAPFLQATGGEYGYGRLVAAGSYPVGGGVLLYGVEGLHYDGPFVLNDNFNKGSGVLRYSHGGDSGGYYAELMAYQAHWDSSDQIPQRAVSQGLISEFGCIDCTDAGSTYRYSLSGGIDQQWGVGTLRASAYAIRYHLNLYSDFTYYANAANLALLPQDRVAFQPDPSRPTDQFEQFDTRNIYGGQLSYRLPIAVGGLRFEGEAGLQTRYDHVDPSGLYATQSRDRFFTVVQDRVGEWSGATYVQTDVKFAEWARAQFGLRYDRYRFDVDANLAGNSGTAEASITSPKLSLVLGPFYRTELFLNVGKGFHSNDARGVTETQTPTSPGNPAPSSATPASPLAAARGLDAGVRTNVLPHVQFSASFFVLDLDSELTLDGDSGTTGIGAATRREGVETSLFWRPLQHLVIDADYAYTHARFREPLQVGSPGPGESQDGSVLGKRIAEAPTSVIALGATYQSGHGWDGALRLRYFGPRPLNEDGSISSHATKLLNASVGYRFTPHLHVSLEGTNLLDSRDHDVDYYYASQLKGEAVPVNDVHFHPVEPIAGRVVVTYAY
ncbi:MAG: TonB-dependent receptor [Nevskia sp.]|nr:TonB-dependent receptor [Nevskia sp.]